MELFQRPPNCEDKKVIITNNDIDGICAVMLCKMLYKDVRVYYTHNAIDITKVLEIVSDDTSIKDLLLFNLKLGSYHINILNEMTNKGLLINYYSRLYEPNALISPIYFSPNHTIIDTLLLHGREYDLKPTGDMTLLERYSKAGMFYNGSDEDISFIEMVKEEVASLTKGISRICYSELYDMLVDVSYKSLLFSDMNRTDVYYKGRQVILEKLKVALNMNTDKMLVRDIIVDLVMASKESNTILERDVLKYTILVGVPYVNTICKNILDKGEVDYVLNLSINGGVNIRSRNVDAKSIASSYGSNITSDAPVKAYYFNCSLNYKLGGINSLKSSLVRTTMIEQFLNKNG